MVRKMVSAIVLMLAVSSTVWGQADSVRYVPKYKDPANEELRKLHEAREEALDSLTDIIEERQRALEEYEEKNERWIKCDLSKIAKPGSPEDFRLFYHFPPSRQYWTGTCWAFSTTSFIETEVYRLYDKQIKLSVMHTVYWEWVEKARRFVAERGKSTVWSGSESNAVFRVMEKYGAVPLDAYPGYIDDARHDHKMMDQRIREYLRFVEDKGVWDEDLVVESVKLILNQHMGTPPEQFEFDGQVYTPKTFLAEVLKLHFDDYVCIMSTMAQPFYSQGPFDVPDNWWFDSSYYNVPLDEWYAILKNAIRNGYTMAIGGDISEAGLNGHDDVAIVAEFDIPQEYINQHSREYRMYNRTTTDDHGIHIVGWMELDGRDWYLVKESSSRGYWGEYKGYMFYRDDYVRLKMMEFTVHRDAAGEMLKKFAATAE